MISIAADAEIPLAKEAFGALGAVRLLDGRSMNAANIGDASMLLVRSVTPVNQALLADTRVKFVATATVGVDHIDTECLMRNHIGFASASGCNAVAVAEYVMAALLHLAGRDHFDLHGKALGIIGVGNVGGKVFERAHALGMRCLLCDPPKQRQTGNALFLPLDEVLANADIVTVHVSLSHEGPDATAGMINRRFLAAVKNGAALINTSRGAVCDDAALREARDKLSGVVLDVWNNEPSIDPAIVAAADVATPHIAGYSLDGKVRATEMIYRAACGFLFREPAWSASGFMAHAGTPAIDLRHSRDPVHDAVREACPITRDDTALRKAIKGKKADIGAAFDALRREYPLRREFDKYRIVNVPAGEEKMLRDLGFGIER